MRLPYGMNFLWEVDFLPIFILREETPFEVFLNYDIARRDKM